MQTAPCGARGLRDYADPTDTCPWVLWTLSRDGRRPGGIYGHGPARGKPRYQCECGATFYRPAPGALQVATFREYAHWEALAAVTFLNEPKTQVASRLGIDRKTVQRWIKDPDAQEHFQLLNMMFRRETVRTGRFIRMVGLRKNPFYALAMDGDGQRLYEKAAFGELRFQAIQGCLMDPVALSEYEAIMADTRAPQARRVEALDSLRETLWAAHPDLFDNPPWES